MLIYHHQMVILDVISFDLFTFINNRNGDHANMRSKSSRGIFGGKNGAGQELSCKNGAGHKKKGQLNILN